MLVGARVTSKDPVISDDLANILMVLIKFLIWGQFLCLWTKCRVRTELFSGGRTSVEEADLAIGDSPSNQTTFSLTAKSLQSGVR